MHPLRYILTWTLIILRQGCHQQQQCWAALPSPQLHHGMHGLGPRGSGGSIVKPEARIEQSDFQQQCRFLEILVSPGLLPQGLHNGMVGTDHQVPLQSCLKCLGRHDLKVLINTAGWRHTVSPQPSYPSQLPRVCRHSRTPPSSPLVAPAAPWPWRPGPSLKLLEPLHSVLANEAVT